MSKKVLTAQVAPESKREKAKGKGEKMKEKMAAKRRKLKGAASALTLFVFGLMLAGCQAANPASRSNRTSYGDIYASVCGTSNTVRVTVGDGTYADASGGGDTQSNTPTQTTDTKPEVAVGVGGGAAGTGGAKPSSGIAGDALKKLMGIFEGNGEKLTAGEAAAIKDCVDGSCQ